MNVGSEPPSSQREMGIELQAGAQLGFLRSLLFFDFTGRPGGCLWFLKDFFAGHPGVVTLDSQNGSPTCKLGKILDD